ncbi:deoxynucleotide monophosphate kinase family protein [Streptomyces sp. 6N106]|uniref:deoxynucleotide monophosphate kinase family protein n=1 Tax=Streptomyces sp. 6N106 TaxID=3457418 RepID=UPI003FCF6FAF
MKHVALIGKARRGKDTVAGILVRHAGYTRLAFADRLREAALRVDPIVASTEGPDGPRPLRMAEVVERFGWEYVKEYFPESRRFLQNYGQTIREMDPYFWVRPVADQVWQGTRLNMPCVVSDVRYLNEVETLRELGATVVRVRRLGAGLSGDAANHSSETELDSLIADHEIYNDGTLDDLRDAVHALSNQLDGITT